MIEFISNVIGVATMSFAHIFSWYGLSNKKIDYRDIKFYITLFLSIVLLLTGVFFLDKFLKIAYITVVFMVLNFYLLRQGIKNSMLMSIMTQIIIMVSETGLALIFYLFDVDLNAIVNQMYGGFTMNIAVSIMVILITVLDFLPKIYEWILKKVDKVNSQYFIFLSFISILVANVLAATVYYKIDFKYLLLFNSFVTIVYFIIIMHSFSNRNNYLKVSDKYNTTLSSLKEYEDILNKYRVSNHENKNQLLTIRHMIKNKEKNISEYIDKIVENKIKDSEKLMGESMIIPEGGLRGLVYSKMLVMKQKEIDFDLSVDKAIRTVELIKLGEQTVLDICKIIGVFLDNAIEAVEKLEEKFVDLEMIIEDETLYISVTNNFAGFIDLDRIEEKGFSTKGGSHGYGLTLVRELIDSNSLLKNEKQIRSNDFTQRLIINLKK